MGFFRFFLALAVMASHYAGHHDKLNMGVTAVIGFYILSGFLMQKSYSRFLEYSHAPVRAFYIDRLIKLMPLYLLVVTLTAVSIYFLPVSLQYPILNQDLSFAKLVSNILLLPVNYVFEPLVIESNLPHPLIPPVWSLATEFHFYLLIPLLFLLSCRQLKGLLIFSMLIHLSAGLVDSTNFSADAFGYRYLPGVIQFFLIGLLVARGQKVFVVKLWVAYAVVLLIFSPAVNLSLHGWMNEQWLGVLMTLPVLFLLLNSPFQQYSDRLNYWDKRLGDLAYPIFLAHFLVFFWVESAINFLGTGKESEWFISLFGVIAVSVILSKIQSRTESLRIHLRGFSSLRRKL